MTLIECNALTKKYGNFTALSNLDLQIESGHIIGLLGPNRPSTAQLWYNLHQRRTGGRRQQKPDLLSARPHLFRSKYACERCDGLF